MKCVRVWGGVCQESVWCMKNDTGVVRVCLDGLTQGHLGMSAEFITVNLTDFYTRLRSSLSSWRLIHSEQNNNKNNSTAAGVE